MEQRSSAPWGPVRWVRDHPAGADAVLAVLVGTVALGGLLTIDPDSVDGSNRDPDAIGVALVVVQAALLAFRRRWPLQVLWLSAAALVPYWVLDYVDSGTSLVILFVLYTAAASCDRARAMPHLLGVTAILVSVMVAGVLAEEEDLPPIAVVANAVIFLGACVLGDSVRNRRAYLEEVEARADRAERDQEAAALRAVQEERTRIARDLHDVVAHSVSVMVVQAGAARRVLDRNPEQAAQSLEVIERTGRDALDELRRVLGVLRSASPEAPMAAQPTAADVAALVAQVRRAGLAVDLHIDGDEVDLTPGVSLTVYRVVQEALTNVLKHAGPASATVDIGYGADAVSIAVADDGRGPAPVDDSVASSSSAQQGLMGMRERVELFGGSLTTGARPGGGFRVRATLPVTSPVGVR